MKKVIITIIAIATMMSLASCGTERSVGKTYFSGSDSIYVTERTMKDGEVIEETNYTIQYESVEDALNAWNEWLNR